MKKIFLLLIFSIIFSDIVFSQGEISTEENLVFRQEKSIGLSFNTNGWRLDYRTGKFINANKSRILQYSFTVIKHPQELKLTNYTYSSSRFVFGKLNSCFDFRFGIGRQNQIFKKEDIGSVEIRFYGIVGPILAIMKPIYYEISDKDGERVEQYLDKHQLSDYVGKASFFKGISEITPNAGLFLNMGVGFEHGKKATSLRSIDVGFSAYAFMTKMEIMANDNNSQFFFVLYATYRIGNFSHGRHLSGLNEEEELF